MQSRFHMSLLSSAVLIYLEMLVKLIAIIKKTLQICFWGHICCGQESPQLMHVEGQLERERGDSSWKMEFLDKLKSGEKNLNDGLDLCLCFYK